MNSMIDDGEPDNDSAGWHRLPLQVLPLIAASLPSNEVTLCLRAVDKRTAAAFAGQRRVKLSDAVLPAAFAAHWGREDAWRCLSSSQRQDLLALVARSGVLPNLQLAAAHAGVELSGKALEAAAGAGHLEACVWLVQAGCPLLEAALEAAAGGGHAEVARWLVQQQCPTSLRTMEAPAAAGHVHVVQALLELRVEWTIAALCAAVRGGHEAVMDALLACPQRHVRHLVEPGEVPAAAARGGHVDLMDRLMGHPRYGIHSAAGYEAVLAGAAAGCALDVLQRLHAECLADPRCNGRSPANAQHAGPRGFTDPEGKKPAPLTCAAGSPTPDWRDKVEWLRAQGYSTGAGHMVERALLGPAAQAAERVRWLHGLGYPLTESVANEAAARGCVEVLGYALTHHVQVNQMTTLLAASSNQLACLQLLHAHGCPIHPNALREAARHRNSAMFKWIVQTHFGPAAVAAAAAQAPGEGAGGSGAGVGAASGAAQQRVLLPPDDEGADDAALGPWQQGEDMWSMAAAAAAVAAAAAAAAAAGAVRRAGGTWPPASAAAVAAAAHAQAQVQASAPARGPFGTPGGAQQGEQGADLVALGALVGDVELLEWLLARGCALGPAAFASAAAGGCRAVLDWLLARGCPMGDDGAAYHRAAAKGDTRTLAALRQLGCPWGPPGELFTRCVRDGGCGVQVLAWLLRHGCCPVDWEAAERAAAMRWPVATQRAVAAWVQQARAAAAGEGAGEGEGPMDVA